MSFLVNSYLYLSPDATLSADAGTFTLTGVSAAFARALRLQAAAGSFTLTGEDADLTTGNPDLAAETGMFTLTGNAAALSRALGLAASSGSFSLTGNAAALDRIFTLLADSGSFALTGVSNTFKRALVIAASQASFTLTGNAATLDYSNASDAVVAFANFQLPSATGNFTISTSDLGGRTPKMVVLCLSNAEVSETASTVSGEEGFHTFGAADGTSQWSVTASSESGTNNDRRAYTTSSCLLMTNATGTTTYLDATFSSFAADQVTINIGTLNAEVYLKRGFAIFFAGTDCDAEVGVINGETDGSATKTLGITPEGLLLGYSDQSATGNVDRAVVSFGFAINDGFATQYDGSRDLGSGTGEARINNKGAGHGAGASAHSCTISFSGSDVTAAWSTAIERDVPYAAWSFDGRLTAKAGTITSPTSAGNVTASGLGITPSAALFITGPGAVNTTVAGGGFGAGWLTGSGGGSMGCLSKTGYCSTTRLNVANGADLASLSSFSSGQLTLNFSTADATARLLPFIAFGT